MPDLFDFKSQFPARGIVELVPAVEQQQHSAVFDEANEIPLAYVSKSGTLATLANRLGGSPDQSPKRK